MAFADCIACMPEIWMNYVTPLRLCKRWVLVWALRQEVVGNIRHNILHLHKDSPTLFFHFIFIKECSLLLIQIEQFLWCDDKGRETQRKGRPAIRPFLNVRGWNKGPKTELHLISPLFAGVLLCPAPAAGMKPLQTLLRLIAGTRWGH